MGRTVGRRSGVQSARCRDCGSAVLTAVSETGLDVVLDSAPLSPIGELGTAVAGVQTYTRHLVPDEIHHRSALDIRNRPAGTRPRQDVHAAHRCGTTWPALDTPTPAAVAAATDAPPF